LEDHKNHKLMNVVNKEINQMPRRDGTGPHVWDAQQVEEWEEVAVKEGEVVLV
jgi:hypothetical protein